MSTQRGYADEPESEDGAASASTDPPTVQYPAPALPPDFGATAEMPVAPPPDFGPTTEMPVAPPPDLEASGNATAGLMTSASSDRCSNCGSQLAPDQRYCVVCGERRGRPRFAGATFGSQTLPPPEPASGASGGYQPRSSRFPPTATLIAGVATLLIAMGLGILIGNDSSNNKPAPVKPTPVNVTVNGAAGSGNSAGSSTGASTTASSNSNSTASKSTKATTSSTKAPAKISTAAAQKSAQAASKVLGSSSSNTPPPTVQQGGSCTHGAGCQNGKFTGNFFGG